MASSASRKSRIARSSCQRASATTPSAQRKARAEPQSVARLAGERERLPVQPLGGVEVVALPGDLPELSERLGESGVVVACAQLADRVARELLRAAGLAAALQHQGAAQARRGEQCPVAAALGLLFGASRLFLGGVEVAPLEQRLRRLRARPGEVGIAVDADPEVALGNLATAGAQASDSPWRRGG